MKPKTVDEYLATIPEQAREKLNELRAILKSIAPNATEELKWGQPVLTERRILYAYGAHKNHMTFMPTGPSLAPFQNELAGFKTGKDTIQFSYDQPLPVELIKKIAAYRYKDVVENDAKWMY